MSIGQALAQAEVTGLAGVQGGTAGSGWEWFPEKGYGNGVRLLFARGVAPGQIIVALGCDPADTRPLAEEATWDTFGDWARVGTAGEWGFSADSGSISVWDLERIARELSAGTDLVLFQTGPDRDYFQYFAGGIEVTAFEPLLARDRTGSEPDRFLPQMRQAGLRVDGDQDEFRDPALALLDMLTLALGITLPRERHRGAGLRRAPLMAKSVGAAARSPAGGRAPAAPSPQDCQPWSARSGRSMVKQLGEGGCVCDPG